MLMRKSFALISAVCLVGIYGFARAAAQQVQPAAATVAPTVDDVLKAVRSDLKANRSEIIAKNVALTSEQAAKFWPAFEAYQKEQNAIMDEQMKGIQTYVDSLEKLDDAAALGLIKAHIDRDRRMATLREKWLGEFQKVLPAKLAVRVMQIDRRISLAHQVEFAARIPLAQ
jgi:Spy/CpxP family protein refolding chaperone